MSPDTGRFGGNMDATLIYNPNSGKGQAKIRAADFAEHWRKEFGTELNMRPTKSLEDIRVAARETINSGLQIFMGGDGTLSESVQGLCEHNDFKGLARPVGLLPGGTGNSFLRDFGIEDYEQARDALLSAVKSDTALNIDLAIIKYLECTPEKPERGPEKRRITFNFWGIGLISDITALAIKMRAIGSLNYSLATIVKLLRHRPMVIDAEIDGKRENLECNFITVSNSRYTGGAMEIAPEVRVNDGKLYLVCPQLKSKGQLFGLFPSIFKGTHVNHPMIRTQFLQKIKLRSEDPILMNVDGELEIGYDPEMQIQPSFWKIYMPAERLKSK